MEQAEPFEVYAIRYATLQKKAAENFIAVAPGSDFHEQNMPMDYFVWVAKNASKTWIIDTGFNQAAADKRKREFLRSPATGLSLLGIEASEVENVIVTHLHYDHIGNFDLFPQAQFHLQDSEMAYATGRYMATPYFSQPFEEEEVVAMVRNVYAGRVEFYDGDHQLAPGISLHHVGGHTKGLQVVRIWTRVGWLVLASDASHYSANINQQNPFPVVVDIAEMVDGWKKIHTLVDDPCHIIPGHDPQVMLDYQAPDESMEGIIVRLDAEPQAQTQ